MSNQSYVQYLSPVSRSFLAFIFIVSGLSKIPGWDQTAGFMAQKGMFWVPLFLFLTIVIEVVGGIFMLLGYKARASAGLVFLYLIPVTLVFHDFWAFEGMEAQMQLINFMKNMAIMGGLLGMVVNGAGAFSLDKGKSQTQLAGVREIPKRAA